MKVDTADAGTPTVAISRDSGDGSPSTKSAQNVLPAPATTASAQRIDHHRSTWPMVSLMANVVMVTAAVTAGIMHAMSSSHGGLYQALSLASSMLSSAFALTIALVVWLSLACTTYPLVNFSLHWACAMPQERKARTVPNHRLAHATPLSCARDDNIRCIFRSIAKVHLLSAAGCLIIALLHAYWILGHHVLRLPQCSNPTLVTHASHFDTSQACDVAVTLSARFIRRSSVASLHCAQLFLDADLGLHDVLFDAAFSAPEVLAGQLSRYMSFSTQPENVKPSPDSKPRMSPTRGRLSAPIATNARVMLAGSVRRNPERRSRHLRDGRRCISFVVDSGWTWHIHPYLSDLVNVRACDDRVAGIDGRAQQCTAIGRMPVTAINDAGR
eukprot:820657-Pleurochrysis_carterae.AAC.5